jgi:hypothetical protein
LFFEFPELVFAVFKGGKHKAPVNVGLASIKQKGDLLEEPSEHMRDHL